MIAMYGRLSLALLLFTAIQLTELTVATGQSCLRTNHSTGMLPTLRDYRETNYITGFIPHQNQAIVPSYRFHCQGNITEWGVDVNIANSLDQQRYNLDLQVWRPSPTVATDGCYSLVGNNWFSSVVLDQGIARVTPLPGDRIQFQSGDVLGFYVESTRQTSLAELRGVVTLNDFKEVGDRGFEMEEVWFARINNTFLPSTYAVGSATGVLNTFTNAAPVISVSLNIADSATISSALQPTSSLVYGTNFQTQRSQLQESTKYLVYSPTLHSSKPTSTSKTTESLRPSTTQTRSPGPVNDNVNLNKQTIGIITGAAVAVVLLIGLCTVFMIATVTTIIVRKKRPKRNLRRDDSLTSNAAYGTTFQNLAVATTYGKGDIYDYPRFGCRILRSHAAANRTDSQVHNLTPGNIYTMNINSQRKAAYSTSVTSADDEFDPTLSIASQRNAAYGTSVSITADKDFASSITSQQNQANASSVNTTTNEYEFDTEYTYVRYT